MKICIASQTFAPQPEGGAEISTRMAANWLAKSHEVVVLSLGKASDPVAPVGRSASSDGYDILRVPYDNSYLPLPTPPQVSKVSKALWHLRAARGCVDSRALSRLFEKEKFDLIYAQNAVKMQPALFDVAKANGVPVVQHLRDYAFLCPRNSMYRNGMNCDNPCWRCSALTARARRSTSSVGTVIAVSDFVAKRFQTHGLFPQAKWHVLHNTNTQTSAFSAELLADRPAPSEPFTFGYLGAIAVEKGIEVMLRAFGQLQQSRAARLIIGGRGHPDYVAAMTALADTLAPGKVTWLGHVAPETVFAQAEVMIVPSLWHEPQGRVLIEAGTYGIPVFAANSGGIAEVVSREGLGHVYPANNANDLADLMDEASSNGALEFRRSLAGRFPRLSSYCGSAEATGYYAKLNDILTNAAAEQVP